MVAHAVYTKAIPILTLRLKSHVRIIILIHPFGSTFTQYTILKISTGAYIFQRPFLRGIYLEGLMYGGKFTFQNRLGQLVVGRKFTIFTLFYFVFESKFQVQAPRGAYIQRGDLTEGFLRYRFGGLIFGGAYIWRGLFSEFYGIVFF